MTRCLALAALLAAGCGGDDSCLDGHEGCIVDRPCMALEMPPCADSSIRVATLEGPEVGGVDALAARGDIVLENALVHAVIDALDHPHNVAPTGGTLIDLATRGNDDDSLNQVFQAAGLLPGDAAHYDSIETIEGDGFVAVQVRGTLDGSREHAIATRYELRACEPGLRVRTELVNLGRDSEVFALGDGYYWGGRSQIAFTPYEGGGFVYPELELEEATDAYRQFPFLATLPSTRPASSLGCVPCRGIFSGFNSDQVSAAGIAPSVVRPRDYLVLERFIGVVHGEDVGAGADLALDLRQRLFGEPYAALEGTLEGASPGERGATVLISERDPAIPVTQVTPDDTGHFVARVSADRAYLVAVHSFGREVARREVEVARDDVTLEPIAIEPPAVLALTVNVDGAPDHALVLFEPDEATRAATLGSRFGQGEACAPYLGPPMQGSPACDRALLAGPTELAVPPGTYRVYATAGLFATIARADVTLVAGERTPLTLDLQRLPLQPAGTLSADFHVHGGASFDSSLPDRDRIAALLAAGIDVIASTEHDAVHDFTEALDELDANGRAIVISGTETTGQILFDWVPNETVPRVIGHWNFWPVEPDPEGPYRGATWDELAEPGLLFTRMAATGRFDPERGVIQMNHPWSGAELGRDTGFPRALRTPLRGPLPSVDDGSRLAVLARTPEDARFANDAFHTLEVMNGSKNSRHRAYRAVWFYYLSQGRLRAGTANSDSHTLVDNVLGAPRTLVWTEATKTSFDLDAFDRDVREGHMIGTNGPVIEATLDRRAPGLEAFAPSAGASLSIRVSAAPWVPVDEVRIIVNGELAMRLPGLPAGDVLGDASRAIEHAVPLAALGVDRDAFVIVEAGAPLVALADLDCDGIPETSDNDDDGAIGARDVGVTPREGEPSLDATIEVDCATDEGLDTVGPGRSPFVPTDRDDPRHVFSVVVPGATPVAFTNPWLLDLDGGGFAP